MFSPRHLWRILPVLLLVGCATAGASAPPATHRIASASELARQVGGPIPGRNLFALANELKLRPPRTISHVIRHKSPNYPVGHQDQFYVLSEDENRYFTMTATVRAKTPHLYLYVQNGVKVSDAAVQEAATRFERHTYPTDRAAFGSEWTPGVDGDPHITCLVGDLRSSHPAGYFSAEDEYPRLVNPYSNQRELFYINSANTLPGNTDFNLTLSHEFQHMIHWHMHPHESLWLNEGMSMLAEQLNSFSAQGEAGAFLSAPHTQLNTWSGTNDFPHYGAAYLFLSYLHERFGKRFTHEMLADRKYTDFELVDDVLRRLHVHATARQLFAQWAAANYIADRSVAPGIYGYKNLTRRIDVRNTKTVPFSYKGSIPPYTADYVEMDSLQKGKPFKLSFSAPTTLPVVGVDKAPPFWWSNRGDMSQTQLQRDADLTHVKHATLKFQAWWDIEKNYDYAYVEVSKNGGKTYTTLKSTDTTIANPNAASYGNGFTGVSSGWQNQKVDLSPYAGHHIQLRFQYVTDDGQNGQSLLLKGLSIPEIGFKDNYSGWKQQGFLPLFTNALPNNWMVQLIAYTDKGVKVTQLPLSAAKRGSMTIDPGKQGLKKLVVVVFTSAPKTTVETHYKLSASTG